MKKLVMILRKKESSVLLFFVSLFLFCWPFLSMPEEDPGEMFAYFFFAWGIVILVLWLSNANITGNSSSDDSQDSEKGN